MKTVLMLLVVLMMSTAALAQDTTVQSGEVIDVPEGTIVTYPVTIDGVAKWFMSLMEVCLQADVPAYDVHISQMSSDGVVLNMSSNKFVPFIIAAKKCFGNPRLTVQALSGEINASARFQYDLDWPNGNVPTAMDDQLERVTKSGVKVSKHSVVIIVIPVGEISMVEMMPLMVKQAKTNESEPKVSNAE